MGFQIVKLRKKLKSKLSGSRYEHSLSVSFTCICLAMRYGYPLAKAETAGLIHDCAKCYEDGKIVKLCDKHHIPVSSEERKAPAVLHAKYGAWLSKKQDEALYQIMKGTLDYLAKKGSRVDPMTAEAFAFYEDQRKKKGGVTCQTL